jgi:hypothetical protein
VVWHLAFFIRWDYGHQSGKGTAVIPMNLRSPDIVPGGSFVADVSH